jgi:hypothetical protein
MAPTLEIGEEAVGIGEPFPFPQPEIDQADLMGSSSKIKPPG